MSDVDGAERTLSEVASAPPTNVSVIGLGTWELLDVIESPGPAEAGELALASTRLTAVHGPLRQSRQ